MINASRAAAHQMTRRMMLRGAAGFGACALGLPFVSGDAFAQPVRPLRAEQLPSPNFARPRRLVAGLRPYRAAGVNLSTERRADDFVILHNYGHGGAGITLAWGCAADVVERFRRLEANVPTAFNAAKPVAIIGSGVAGLTVASELRDAFPRRRIVIYSRDLLENTTSWLAGGQFAPSSIIHSYDGRSGRPGIGDLHRLVRGSYAKLQALRARGQARANGIVERYNYSFVRNDAFDIGTPCDVVAAPRQGLLPFSNLSNRVGYEYRTWLINPTILLPTLRNALRRSNRVRFRQQVITDVSQLRRDHAIVINCSGLGAATLFGDRTMTPVKGQLVLMERDPDPSRQIRYMFSERCQGLQAQGTYLFGRQNDIVIGGTYEQNVTSTTASRAETAILVDRMNNIFNGSPDACRLPPDSGRGAGCGIT